MTLTFSIVLCCMVLFGLTWLYVLQFVKFTYGWVGLKSSEIEFVERAKFTYAVVIAFRNEAKSIQTLCDEMSQQEGLSTVNWELILVNDHSEDESLSLLQSRHLASNVSVYQLPKGTTGKKAAIAFGVERSIADYIICTDADTTRTKHWLAAIVSFIEHEHPFFLAAPVLLKLVNGNFFERWQQLEFSGLISIGAGAIALNKPNMCNGANLAFKRAIFYEVGGYEDNAHILSGDDEFLMHKIHHQYPGKVKFLKHPDAMVSTEVKVDLMGFLQQRMRWSSKATKYKSSRVIWLSILVYAFTICLPFLFVAGIFHWVFWMMMLVVFAIKFGIEYWFYRKTLPFYGIALRPLFFLVAEIIQIAYVSVIGVLGTFVTYQWKGRKG